MALAATNLVQLKSASGILSDLVMHENHLDSRHRSPRTLESYRLTLEQFGRFLTDVEHTRRTEDVTRRDVTPSWSTSVCREREAADLEEQIRGHGAKPAD